MLARIKGTNRYIKTEMPQSIDRTEELRLKYRVKKALKKVLDNLLTRK